MATIFIGLGGSGIKVVTRIKEKYNRFLFTREKILKGEVLFHGFDIDNPNIDVRESIDFTQVSVPDPKDVIDTHMRKEDIFRKWWPEGYYPENALVPGNAAGRHRFNGRLIFWHNFRIINDALEQIVNRASKVESETGGRQAAHRIFLINSIGGGTGAGMFIDLGFQIREIISSLENFRLYSFLIHGTIWEEAGFTDSETIAFGALTELERWMEKPQEFEMKFFDNKLPSELLHGFDRLFDMVFLIEMRNLEGRVFIGMGTKTLQDQYMDFSSWLLYTLSLREIANEFQNVEAVFNLLDEEDMSKKTSRALRYGSAAVSVITVPYDQIVDWLTGQFVSRFGVGFNPASFEEAAEILKRLKIYEEDANQLSSGLKTIDEFAKISNYANLIASDLDNTENMDAFYDNLNNYKLRELIGIQERVSSWILKVDGMLLSKKEQFDEIVSNLLVENLSDSFDFSGALNYLEELYNKLQLQIKKIDADFSFKNTSSKIHAYLNEIIAEISEMPSEKLRFMFKKGKFRKLLHEWIGKSGFNNFINKNTYLYIYTGEMLHIRLKEFYESLCRITRAKRSLIEAENEIFQKFITKYRERKEQYHYDRSNIINIEKLKNKEYPLLLNVPVSLEDLNGVLDSLDKTELSKSLMHSLWTGKIAGDEELRGMSEFQKKIQNDISTNDGKMVDKIIEQGIAELEKIAKNKLDREISETVNKAFRIDLSLRRYFQRLYSEYKSNLSYPDTLKKTLDKLEYQVGSETLGILQNKKLSEKEWIDTAISGFLRSLASLVKPFWSFESAEARKEFYQDRLNQEDASIFIHKDLDLPLKDFKKIEWLEQDEFRAFLFSYQFGTPLYLLDSVNNAFHKLYESKAGLMPFSDKRFLNEWKDNIEKPSRFEFSDFLFIMALGFGIIQRTRRGKAKGKTFYYGEKNLGRITEAMYTVRDEYSENLKEEIKAKILEDIYNPSLANTQKVEKYNQLLSEVEKELDSIKPPKTKGNLTAWSIWTHLKEKVATKRDARGNVLKLEGEFYRNSKVEIDDIIYEHTGIKI